MAFTGPPNPTPPVLIYALQGIVFALAGYLLYEAGEYGFKLSKLIDNDSNYQPKEIAQAVLVVFFIFSGALSGEAIDAIRDWTYGFSTFQIIGVIIISSRIFANLIVDRWKMFSPPEKAIRIWIVGAILFVHPYFI